MREGADATHGALQLAGREARVKEALYERYPEMRPSTEVVESRPCPRCAKRTDGTPCRDHRSRSMTKAERARLEREQYSATAQAAKAAGRRAAGTVDLGAEAAPSRLDRYTETERHDAREIWGAIGS
jgi:hypothetical protein